MKEGFRVIVSIIITGLFKCLCHSDLYKNSDFKLHQKDYVFLSSGFV